MCVRVWIERVCACVHTCKLGGQELTLNLRRVDIGGIDSFIDSSDINLILFIHIVTVRQSSPTGHPHSSPG